VTTSADLVTLLAETADNPTAHAELVQGARLYPWQREITDEVARRLHLGERRIRILVRASHSAGKSYLAACLLLWFMSTRPSSRGMTLAPKWQQILDVIWPEVRRLYDASLLGRMSFGRCLTDRVEFGPTWFATGAASDKPETLEGQHSLVGAIRIVDEAKAVEDSTFTSTDGLLASAESFDLWISTAGTTQGKFYRRDVVDGDDVIRRKLTVDDLIREGVPGATEWKLERLKDWGENSVEFRSRAMAEYVSDAEDALYPASWIERATSAGFTVDGRPVAGLDVAGSVAGDASALAIVAGPDGQGRFQVKSVAAWHERETALTRGKALHLARDAGARVLAVDVVGLGQGVADAMRDEKGIGISSFRASASPKTPDRFTNRKAEIAWELRSLLEAKLIAIPKHDGLRRELLAMKYQVTPQGKIRIVDPSDSPDLVDSVLIALASASQIEPFAEFIPFEKPQRSEFYTPQRWHPRRMF